MKALKVFLHPIVSPCLFVMLLLLPLACKSESTEPKFGTETNWLTACDTDGECTVGSCVCGVCTFECSSGTDCEDAPEPSRCASAGDAEYERFCSAPSVPGICLETESAPSDDATSDDDADDPADDATPDEVEDDDATSDDDADDDADDDTAAGETSSAVSTTPPNDIPSASSSASTVLPVGSAGGESTGGSGGGGATGGLAGNGGSQGGSGGAQGGAGGAGSGPGTEECPDVGSVIGVVLDGDILIDGLTSLEPLHQLSGCTGSLVIGPDAPAEVALPNLREIRGDLQINSSSLVELSLPRLTRVDGEVYIYLNPDLAQLDLRSLETIGQRLFLHRNPVLTTFGLGALTSVPTELLDVTGNLQVPDCEVVDLFSRIQPDVDITNLPGYGIPDCTCENRCNIVTATCPTPE